VSITCGMAGRRCIVKSAGMILEGIVEKWARGVYETDGRSTSWVTIKNPDYSQMEGRYELFETRAGMHRRNVPVVSRRGDHAARS
jgi:hypothetical protein